MRPNVARNLVLSVRLHDRFHGMAFGAPEWPPSPARVFQALVAGVGRGQPISDDLKSAFEWLEGLEPPVIGAPRSRLGAEVALWVPNNDLDSKGGDPANLPSIRTEKRGIPRLIEGDEPLLYVWSWEGSSAQAEIVVRAAESLYQLGRGVDLGWAQGALLDDDAVELLLGRYPGVVHRPAGAGDRRGSLCPMPGSFESLERRFAAKRITEVIDGKRRSEVYQNPPKPLFRAVRYGRREVLRVFDLIDASDDGRLHSVALRNAAALVQCIRDAAADRLKASFPDSHADIERILIGRKADGRDGGPIEDRVRIVPLPSIGHPHADMAVRRIAVALPGGVALSVEDLTWAFDGLQPANSEGAASLRFQLVRTSDASMLDRYTASARQFRSVTPIVLPNQAARRRIEPSRRSEEAKAGQERCDEESRARAAVHAALRQAGILARVDGMRVQREPLDRRGVRAESFAEGTRFAKERLWHVDVTLNRFVDGPLVIGDGRFLGLGVMAPVRTPKGVYAFEIESGIENVPDPLDLTRAMRRAVMARVQEAFGKVEALPSYFSGHDGEGGPARGEGSAHLSFAFDVSIPRLLVIAPHLLERREPFGWERRYLELLNLALQGLVELRAGRSGLLSLRRLVSDVTSDAAFAPAKSWRTLTPYVATRHQKRIGAVEALSTDVLEECRRRGLPEPRVVTVRAVRGMPGIGLVGDLELEFATAVAGPILIGRNRHFGGGLFSGAILPANPEKS